MQLRGMCKTKRLIPSTEKQKQNANKKMDEWFEEMLKKHIMVNKQVKM
jgi:hypothetical protein